MTPPSEIPPPESPQSTELHSGTWPNIVSTSPSIWKRNISGGTLVGAVLLVFLVVSLWAFLRPAQRWEYKIAAVPDEIFETEIARMGNEGWEMVFARRATSETGDPTTAQKPRMSYEMIFKRPIGPFSSPQTP